MSTEGGPPAEGAPPEAAKSAGPYRVSRAAGIYAVVIWVVLNTFSSTDRSMLSVMVEEIKRDLLLSDFQVGLLQGIAFIAFYSTLGIFMGAAADRFPRRWIIYLGVSAWSLAAAGAGLAQNYAQLFLARMAIGLGESSLGPSVASMASDMFSPKRLSSVMSAYAAAGLLGTGTALALGGFLMDNMEHWRPFLISPLSETPVWRLVLYATGLPGLLLALLAFTLKEPPRRSVTAGVEPVSWKQFGVFFNERRSLILRVILGYGLLSMSGWPILAWAPTYARRVLELSPGEIGPPMGLIVGVCGVLATLGSGFIADYLFGRGVKDAGLRVAAIGGIMALPLGVAAFVVPSTTLFFLGIAAIQILILSHFGSGLAVMQLISPPRVRGRMTALMLMTSNLVGVALGPLAVGALTDFVYRSNEKVGLSIATVLAVCLPAAVLLLWSARGEFKRNMVTEAA